MWGDGCGRTRSACSIPGSLLYQKKGGFASPVARRDIQEAKRWPALGERTRPAKMKMKKKQRKRVSHAGNRSRILRKAVLPTSRGKRKEGKRGRGMRQTRQKAQSFVYPSRSRETMRKRGLGNEISGPAAAKGTRRDAVVDAVELMGSLEKWRWRSQRLEVRMGEIDWVRERADRSLGDDSGAETGEATVEDPRSAASSAAASQRGTMQHVTTRTSRPAPADSPCHPPSTRSHVPFLPLPSVSA